MPPMIRLAQQTITTRIRTGSASVESSTRMSCCVRPVGLAEKPYAGEHEMMSYGPRAMLRIWSMFGAAPVGYGRDQYRI